MIYAGIRAVAWQNVRKTTEYVQHFTLRADLNTFVETEPKIDLGPKRVPHAVLLLHGWSASPQEFEALILALKAHGIPYYAPQLTGFGLGDLHLLYTIKAADWLRDALYSYDLLAAVAQKVSIIGHSNGGVLAVYIAQQRPVKHLILSAPYLAVAQQDKVYKTVLHAPIIAHLVKFCLPVFNKPGRSNKTHSAPIETFRYPTLPIQSLVALWHLQDYVAMTKANFQDLTVLYGQHDQDVDMPAVLAKFTQQGVSYHAIAYLQAAHNLLQSNERATVIKDILTVLAH